MAGEDKKVSRHFYFKLLTASNLPLHSVFMPFSAYGTQSVPHGEKDGNCCHKPSMNPFVDCSCRVKKQIFLQNTLKN